MCTDTSASVPAPQLLSSAVSDALAPHARLAAGVKGAVVGTHIVMHTLKLVHISYLTDLYPLPLLQQLAAKWYT
jgi:hypothetical protein